MATTASSLPVTSAAVNIQIIEPKNYAGAEAPAPAASSGKSQGVTGTQSTLASGTADSFTTNTSSSATQVQGGSDQQLQDAYHQAQQDKMIADQSRNTYLELANTLNEQAYHDEMSNQHLAPTFVPPAISGWQGSSAGLINQPINQPNMTVNAPGAQPAPNPFELPAAPAVQPAPASPRPPALPQAPSPSPALHSPAQPEPQQRPALPPASIQTPEVQQAEVIHQLPLAQLNQMIAEAPSVNLKLQAIGQVAARQQADSTTFELLHREALTDTSQLLNPIQKSEADKVRKAAIWTLGILDATVNRQAPSGKLPSLETYKILMNNPLEDPGIKAAVMAGLQTLDRREPATLTLAEKGLQDPNPSVQVAARDFIAGKTMPIPPATPAPPEMPALPTAGPALPMMPSPQELAQMQEMLKQPGAKEQVAQMLSEAGMPVTPGDIDQMMQLMAQGQSKPLLDH